MINRPTTYAARFTRKINEKTSVYGSHSPKYSAKRLTPGIEPRAVEDRREQQHGNGRQHRELEAVRSPAAQSQENRDLRGTIESGIEPVTRPLTRG